MEKLIFKQSPGTTALLFAFGMYRTYKSPAILEGNRRHLEFSDVKNCILRVLRARGSACGAI